MLFSALFCDHRSSALLALLATLAVALPAPAGAQQIEDAASGAPSTPVHEHGHGSSIDPAGHDGGRDGHGAVSHGPHEHGVATLSLVLEGEELAVELLTPAVNLLGFEHRPQSDAERTALQAAAAQLQRGGALLGLTPAARCQQQSVQIDSPLMAVYDNRDRQRAIQEAGAAGEVPPAEQADVHADFVVSYRFRCAAPTALQGLDLQLFRHFPGLQRIALPWLRDGRQAAATATPQRPRVSLQ